MSEKLEGRLQVFRHYPEVICRAHRTNKVRFGIGDDGSSRTLRELVCLSCLRAKVEEGTVDLTGPLEVVIP